MRLLINFVKRTRDCLKDQNFLHGLESIESVVSKVLSILMVLVTVFAVFDLSVFLVQELWSELTSPNHTRFSETLFKIFGLFLNILIALEILENITAYLKKHVIQVELVIVTSLIAVARKIIILDLSKTSGVEVIGLGVAIFSLSVSYWIVRRANLKQN
ncbi:phosphate-starvation-inducible PsiE family protein [Phormidesmis priestleyi]|uniref:phosphate-starvation-inducible PsiE family protein n=1 Tax=Phormidesmis priestleyi TaxID=268141 RepID=UPI00083B5093|nr:phosphate-starvation-inducible PsiE family protein [Phormidesmis priestleyi]